MQGLRLCALTLQVMPGCQVCCRTTHVAFPACAQELWAEVTLLLVDPSDRDTFSALQASAGRR